MRLSLARAALLRHRARTMLAVLGVTAGTLAAVRLVRQPPLALFGR